LSEKHRGRNAAADKRANDPLLAFGAAGPRVFAARMLPLWDTQPHRRAPVITALLLAVNLAVFGYEVVLALAGGSGLHAFVRQFAVVPSRLVNGWSEGSQWLTVLTAMFLHGSPAHLLGNGWFLWIFGRSVESALGPGRFLAIYLAAGVAGTAVQVATGPGSAVPMLGASGAISGVLGVYFVLFPTAWVVSLVPWIVPVVPIPAFVFLILWFLLQTLNGFGDLMAGADRAGGGVAWWAHAGGFIAGVLLASTRRRARRGRR